MGDDFIKAVKKLSIKVGPPRLTRFEKARIIAARALQLALGALPLISITDGLNDPVEIAKRELQQGVLPITLVRRRPGGEEELIPVGKLIELEKRIFGRVEI